MSKEKLKKVLFIDYEDLPVDLKRLSYCHVDCPAALYIDEDDDGIGCAKDLMIWVRANFDKSVVEAADKIMIT